MAWLNCYSTWIEAQPKKVDAMLNLQPPPRNAGELRSFLGLVNFYRDLYPLQSHLLFPFYNLTNSTDKRAVRISSTKEHDNTKISGCKRDFDGIPKSSPTVLRLH